MSNSIISEGKTTNEAIENGLKILHTTKNNVDIKVLESDDKIISMANEIVEKKIPVREIENISVEAPKKNKFSRRTPSSNEYKYAEDILREKLDTKVKIKDNKIELYFTNVADLNRILDVIGNE